MPRAILPDDARYTFVFDKLEILLALGHLDRLDEHWAPIGAFGYREDNRNRIMREILDSLLTQRDHSPFVACGIFGDTAEVCSDRMGKLQEFLARTQWW